MPELSLEGLKAMIPHSQLQELDKGRQQESDQALMLLAYQRVPSKVNRTKAIRQFRQDYRDANLLPHFAPHDLTIDQLDDIEFDLLQKLLALDGEVRLSQLPQKGICNLYSRILHYRLILLGLFDQNATAPFSQATIQSLQQMQGWLQPAPDLLSLANLCGNISALIQLFSKRGRLDQRVLAFQYSAPSLAPDLLEEVTEDDGEQDDEDRARLEEGWDKSLQDISEQVLGKEEALIQRYEHRNRNKKRRLERIRQLMLHILDEQKALLNQRLQEEEQLQEQIDQADSRKKRRQLKRKLRRLREQREAEQGNRQKQLRRLSIRLKRLQAKVNGLGLRFKAKLNKSLTQATYDKLNKNVFQRRDTTALDQLVLDPYNSFLIRLLQVTQWTSGYYIGRLNSVVDDQTFDAVINMVEDIPRMQLKYIMTKLGGPTEGYWLLNIHYLFERFSRMYARRGHNLSDSALFEQYEQHFEEAAPTTGNALMQKAWEEYHRDMKKGGAGQLIQSFYTGTKSLVRSLLRVIGRFALFIRKVIEKLTPLFKNFVKILYKAIRAGARKYAIGLSYLITTGKLPQINAQTVEQILTRFIEKLKKPDALVDGTTGFVPTEEEKRKARNLAFGVVLALRVIKWGIALATGSITWPRLAIRIALLFKDMIKQWVFKRQKGAALSVA